MSAEEPEPITWDGLVEDLAASETDIRAMQHSVSHIDARFKKGGRTDLMPGRHMAVALTALEEARLRVQEAERLVSIYGKQEP
jgi:hypothetical protein